MSRVGLDFFRERVLPDLRSYAGFEEAMLLVDRALSRETWRQSAKSGSAATGVTHRRLASRRPKDLTSATGT
jgi:hypothetical protein